MTSATLMRQYLAGPCIITDVRGAVEVEPLQFFPVPASKRVAKAPAIYVPLHEVPYAA